jgi:radical SAM protein with 4Fe4S-binding SPASM domain
MTKTIEIQKFALWDKLRGMRFPSGFDIEITARCNNDCRHCYINLPADDRTAKAGELTLDEISGIAGQAVELGALWCLITGGEPLLREDFSDIYMSLKRRGLLVSVFTNAIPIHDEHIALFKKYPPRDIEITVYGASAETYERVTRKPGSFAAFTRGLNRLLENGIRVRLKAMALRSNVHELTEISRFCREHTKDYFRFDPLLHLRFDGDPARNAEIRSERLSPEEIAAVERADTERFASLEKNCDSLINEEFAHNGCNHLFHCGTGNGSYSVSADGKFRLCSSLWAPETLYDLRHGTLREAWEKHVPNVREMRSDRKEFLETCRKCELINLCLWCPAHAHLETGVMDTPVEYFCEVAHARAKALKESVKP